MIVNFFFVFGSLIEFAIVNNTKSDDSSKKQQGVKTTEEQVKLLTNDRKPTVVNDADDYITSAMTSSIASSPMTSCEVNGNGVKSSAVDGLDMGDVVSTPSKGGGERVAQKKMGFLARLVIKRDVDDIAKLFFPTSFVVWHVVFALMGYYAMED